MCLDGGKSKSPAPALISHLPACPAAGLPASPPVHAEPLFIIDNGVPSGSRYSAAPAAAVTWTAARGRCDASGARLPTWQGPQQRDLPRLIQWAVDWMGAPPSPGAQQASWGRHPAMASLPGACRCRCWPAQLTGPQRDGVCTAGTVHHCLHHLRI